MLRVVENFAITQGYSNLHRYMKVGRVLSSYYYSIIVTSTTVVCRDPLFS